VAVRAGWRFRPRDRVVPCTSPSPVPPAASARPRTRTAPASPASAAHRTARGERRRRRHDHRRPRLHRLLLRADRRGSGRVALYLAITMAPFTVLAPVIGPLLDKLPHGRRAAMAAAMLARALLALIISGAVASGSLELYPAALGALVASKAYGVVSSAVVPRLLPPRFSLVKANSGSPSRAARHRRRRPDRRRAPGHRVPLAALRRLRDLRRGYVPVFLRSPKVDSAKGEDTALLAADADHLHGPHLQGGQASGAAHGRHRRHPRARRQRGPALALRAS
jgi:hypothetical protein